MSPLLLLALAPLADTTAPEPYRQLDRALDSLRIEYQLPGLAAVAIADGEIAFAKGYGYADLETERPVTPATPFRIASLTKPLAAAALFDLIEEEELDLDGAFEDYVPGWDQGCRFFKSPEVLAEEPLLASLTEDWRCDTDGERLTVRHYMSHTAQGAPGAAYRYNGFLYGQLARVIEAVGERPFAEVLRDDYFAPLDMTRSLPSQADSSRLDLLADLALPYRAEADTFARADFPQPLDLNAGAGVISTALDLARYDLALRDGTAMSAAAYARATTPSRSNATGEDLPYGLGWFTQTIDGEAVVWHYGWQPGAYSGLWLRLPERDRTLILLANGEGLSAPFGLGEGDVTRSAFAKTFLAFTGGE